nr:uncharacterized protein LOC113727766 isoform X4 [Coffea arabica]
MSTGLTLSESSSSAAAAAFTNKDNADDLYAAVDMGTNSFKLLIVRADPSTGRFLPIDRHKEPVLLGLDATTTAATVISPSSVDRAIAALSKFQQIMHCLHIPSSHSRFVATSAVREASNQSEFLFKLHQNLNLHVDVLSGQEEAGLIYFGVLQFIPVVNDTVLTIDIGGGSTEIIIGIKKWNEVDNQLVVCFEDKDLEYLEAACLLHNIGLYAGKKGYHKQSYQVIINGNHLQGYSDKEVKLIGLLVKHHRKKIPKSDVDLLEGFEEEVKLKFRMLCAILRLSAIVLQFQSVGIQTFKFSCSDEGFRLVLGEARNQPQSSCTLHPLAGDLKEEIDKEVENFRMVFAKQLSVMIPCST